MTVGKDVSSLLADVVKNGQTANLELKKLVYLYLINYAKSQPDLAILAVNTFVKARPPGARARALRAHCCGRTRKTQTRSSARSPCAPWAASAWTRSPSTSATRC